MVGLGEKKGCFFSPPKKRRRKKDCILEIYTAFQKAICGICLWDAAAEDFINILQVEPNFSSAL